MVEVEGTARAEKAGGGVDCISCPKLLYAGLPEPCVEAAGVTSIICEEVVTVVGGRGLKLKGQVASRSLVMVLICLLP